MIGVVALIGIGSVAVGMGMGRESAPTGAVAGATDTVAGTSTSSPSVSTDAVGGPTTSRPPASSRPDPVSTAVPSIRPVPAVTAAPLSTLVGYQWPLPHSRLTLPFGPTPWGSRIVDGEKFHDGVDLSTFCGDRVVAAHDGIVLAAGRHFDREMGWIGDLTPYFERLDAKKLWITLPIVVVIDDGNGYRSVYAHFGKIVVKTGQAVSAGELLGYEGRTGRASGCHLHYGLFSPDEPSQFAMDPAVVKRMKVPSAEVARVDPLLVLPHRPGINPTTSPAP